MVPQRVRDTSEPLEVYDVYEVSYREKLSDILNSSGFDEIKSLDLSWNKFTDLSSLAGLSGLESLCLSGNQVTDLTPLEKLTGLRNGDEYTEIEAWLHGLAATVEGR